MCFEKAEPVAPARREFLAASAAAIAAASLPAAAQAPGAAAPAPTRVLDSRRISHGPVAINHNGSPALDGYLARPLADGIYPGVIVIAGNRITEEYIPNTCAALALAGFVGLAPNLYHVVPDSARTNSEIASASVRHDEDDVLLDMLAGLNHLRRQPFVRPSNFGVLGFCFGGRIALKLGARSRDIDAVVAYHPAPALGPADVERLASHVQIQSGTIDRAAPVDAMRELQRLLRSNGTPTDLHLNERADHGFLAYTRPHRYDPQAAMLAWTRTTAFLQAALRSHDGAPMADRATSAGRPPSTTSTRR